MKIVGPIKQFDTENRLFSMIIANRVKYFYLQRNLMKKYSKYLKEGRFVTLVVGDDSKIVNNYKAYRVDHFLKIYKQTHREQLVYYDINRVKNQIGDFLNVKGYRMFLDLEMSMHPYYRTKTFKQEIIQAGIVIEDDNGVVETQFDFVRPTQFPNMTQRTVKFLSIKQEEVDGGLSAIEFNKKLRILVDKYDPKIYVWGKNDYLAIKDFAKHNRFRNPMPRTRFVNLLQLYKTYHNLKNDMGLFKCFESYGYVLDKQKHNALEDAEITRLVFKAFRDQINSD